MFNPVILILIILLVPLIIEDFTHRKISLIWLIGIIIASVAYQATTSSSIKPILINTLINFIIIIVHFLILTAYFSLKEKRVIDLKKNYLGKGDIVFLISISFLLSPVNFVLFFFTSLIFSLLTTLIVRLFIPDKFITIPLAGLQSLFLIFVLAAVLFSNKKIEINNDEYITRLIAEYAGIN
jgi:hypothetical protein